MPDEEVPVLIVGGSLVGLTTAMLLGHYGVPSLSVERHAGTAIHPRAGHFQLRTMEVLRQLGLEERVRALPGGLGAPLGEDGTTLSAGERARLALARIVVADRPWMLLDEPTHISTT